MSEKCSIEMEKSEYWFEDEKEMAGVPRKLTSWITASKAGTLALKGKLLALALSIRDLLLKVRE